MNTLVLFAFMACMLVGFVIGAIVGVVLGYDKAETDLRKDDDLYLEVVTPTPEEIERVMRLDIEREKKHRDGEIG